MPIRQFTGRDASFGPDDLKAIDEALSRALAQLRLYDRHEPLVESLARKIIRAALQGERDPARLCDIAVEGIEIASAAAAKEQPRSSGTSSAG